MENSSNSKCLEPINNFKSMKKCLLYCIEKYYKKCEFFKRLIINCGQSIDTNESILNVNTNNIRSEAINFNHLNKSIVDKYKLSNLETKCKSYNSLKINDYNEDEYIEHEYDNCSSIAEYNKIKFIRDKYRSYHILNNKPEINSNNVNEIYHIKITYNIKQPLKNINFGYIPDNWNIPTPTKELNSEYYKEYLKDGSLVTKIYNDMNYIMREKIKYSLKKNVQYATTEDFINKIKSLTRNNKYYFKTDIIGAYYNISFETVLETLKYNSDISEDIEKYLYKFFTFIKKEDGNKDYLYITNYSSLLFDIYLKRILAGIKFISRYDDIILYSNNLNDLKIQFDKLVDALKSNGLYLNKNKSALYNTDVNSIFILKNLINIPNSGKLDETTKNILKEYIKRGEYIKIACKDKNNVLKSILKH